MAFPLRSMTERFPIPAPHENFSRIARASRAVSDNQQRRRILPHRRTRIGSERDCSPPRSTRRVHTCSGLAVLTRALSQRHTILSQNTIATVAMVGRPRMASAIRTKKANLKNVASMARTSCTSANPAAPSGEASVGSLMDTVSDSESTSTWLSPRVAFVKSEARFHRRAGARPLPRPRKPQSTISTPQVH